MVDARSHTCKSHDFIPRYDIILGITASSCDNGHKALLHACYKALQAFYRDFCPFIQQDLAALIKILVWVVHTGDCMAQFIPNMFYGVWGCSPAILQVAPSWWCCLTEGNQALPKHGGVWHYCLRSGNFPKNAAWEMALRCFEKCLSRTHRLGIYKPGTFAGCAHQLSHIPQACHLQGKVGHWSRHQGWHAANGPLSGSVTSVPTPSKDSSGWQQSTGLPCGV